MIVVDNGYLERLSLSDVTASLEYYNNQMEQ